MWTRHPFITAPWFDRGLTGQTNPTGTEEALGSTDDRPGDAQSSPADDYGIAPTGHRLPRDTRLGTVRLQVADLQRSLRYYTSLLGLRVISNAPSMAGSGSRC
ncbi:hypothetical protein BH23GEM6_BH23GEM6_26750 [soil metagenome]